MSIERVLTTSDHLLYIFSWLDEKELCNVAKVCKLWNQVSQHNFLWKPIFNSIFEGRNCSSEPGNIRKTFARLQSIKNKCAHILIDNSSIKYRCFNTKIPNEPPHRNLLQIEYRDNYFILMFSTETQTGAFFKVFDKEGKAQEMNSLPNNILKLCFKMATKRIAFSLQDKSYNKFRFIDNYAYSFSHSTHTIYIRKPDQSTLNLVHSDELFNNDHVFMRNHSKLIKRKLIDHIVLIPDSVILVTACYHKYEDKKDSYTSILFWNLNTGQCFHSIHQSNFSRDPSFFQYWKGYLAIATSNWVDFRNADKEEDHCDIFFHLDNCYLTTLKCSDNAIIAGDQNGVIHIWELPEKGSEEKVDQVFQEQTKKHPSDEPADFTPKKIQKIDHPSI